MHAPMPRTDRLRQEARLYPGGHTARKPGARLPAGLLLVALMGAGSALAEASAAADPPPLAPVQDPAPADPPPTPLVVSIAAASLRGGS